MEFRNYHWFRLDRMVFSGALEETLRPEDAYFPAISRNRFTSGG